MGNFKDAFKETCILEGWDKFTNDPDDAGGKTKYGITEALAREYGYKGKMEDLSYEQAEDIAKRAIWDKLQLDKVTSQKIAFELFDTAFNMGNKEAAYILQAAINEFNRSLDRDTIDEDGMIGALTIYNLNMIIQQYPDQFYACLNGEQYIAYKAIKDKNPRLKKYFIGWMRRL